MQAIAPANRVNEGKNNGLVVDYCGVFKHLRKVIFDILKKPELSRAETRRVKGVAVELLATLKAGKLRADHWREKEATRDAVRVTIHDFLWNDETGLPADDYSEEDVTAKSDEVYRHVYRVYPTLPSPLYAPVA